MHEPYYDRAAEAEFSQTEHVTESVLPLDIVPGGTTAPVEVGPAEQLIRCR